MEIHLFTMEMLASSVAGIGSDSEKAESMCRTVKNAGFRGEEAKTMVIHCMSHYANIEPSDRVILTIINNFGKIVLNKRA